MLIIITLTPFRRIRITLIITPILMGVIPLIITLTGGDPDAKEEIIVILSYRLVFFRSFDG